MRQKIGFCDQPLAWTGLTTMLAAWIWPYLEPNWMHCGLGSVALCGLGYQVRRQFWAWVPAMFGVLLFSWALMSDRPMPPSIIGSLHTHGTVLDRVGGHAIVESPEGMFFVRFADDGPTKGDSIVFWAERADLPRSLAGSWCINGMAQRARAASIRARQWMVLGGRKAAVKRLPVGRHHGSLSGLILGDVSGLSESEESLLRRTGTRHMMAVSGLHLGLASGLVAGLCAFCFRLFVALGGDVHWRIIRICCGLAAFIAARQYAVVAGWSVSSQRALWMIALAALGLCLGRRVSGWSLLGGAVTMLMWAQPWQVTRPGFLLSVSAVAGIFGIAPLFSRWIAPDWSPLLRWALHSISISLGASLGTLPVSAWVFQEWSVVGPLANLWAGPLVSLWIVPQALLGLCSSGWVSKWCWWMAELGLDLFWSGLWLLDLPLWHPALSPFGAVVLGIALFSLRHAGSWLVMAVVLWWPRVWPTGDLVVHFLSVGQGDSALIHWPDGRLWLVDGGPPSTQVLHWLRRKGVVRLDVVVLTHPDADHLGGLLPIVENLEVDELWLSRWPKRGEPNFRRLLQRGVASETTVLGVEQPLHANVMPRYPDCNNDNDCGLVLQIEHGRHRFLMMGDVGISTEKFLTPILNSVDVLRVGHHGSNYSTSETFLERIRPTTSVISVGERNPYGHPGSSALWRLRRSRVLRTDRLGTITVRSDGNEMIWKTESTNSWTLAWLFQGI